MASVTVQNLSKKFGSTVALDQVSFEFEDGKFFALLGPSGSGKTFLKASQGAAFSLKASRGLGGIREAQTIT